jgi:hypothetical protein
MRLEENLAMKKKAAAPKKAPVPKTVVPKYPRHSLEKVLRIPKAILDQNAGKECSEEDTATFLGIKYNRGPYALELSSAIKFGLLERPSAGRIAVSELAKKVLRPQNEQEELVGLREAVLKAPDISTGLQPLPRREPARHAVLRERPGRQVRHP